MISARSIAAHGAGRGGRPGTASLATAILLAMTFARPAAATFTQVNQFGNRATLTIGWCDYDRDGDLDVAVGNSGAQSELFRNDGGGVFVRSVPFGPGSAFAVAWADFDNDGDGDIAIGRGGDAGNRLFVNNGDGTWTQRNEFGASRTIGLAWADYDLDGDLDLAVGNGILGAARQNMLYIQNPDHSFTGQAQFGMGQTDAVAWGDFDNDGDPDLAVGNGGFSGVPEQNYLYVNNGDGTFTERAEFGNDGDTSSLAWGDYDNDGDLDIAIGNWEVGRCHLYVNEGGTFTERPYFGDRDTNTLNWGDADNDGDLDLAVGNGDFSVADSSMLYHNDGAGAFVEDSEFGRASTDAISWGDYDNDGDLDAAVGNEHSPSQNYLYVNNENDAEYVSVRLAGRFHALGAGYSNRDGIGARVYAYRAGHLGDPAHVLAMREIEAHGGFASQNAIEAHFGFPGHAAVDLRIVWPGSGGRRIVQDLAGTTVPQRITVQEAGAFTDVSGLPAPGTGKGAKAAPAIAVTPNPAHGETRIALRGDPDIPGVTVHIWDTAGRLVRSLAVPATPGGARVVTWDGRSSSGVAAPAGVYFARLSGDTDAGRAARIVLLR